MYALFASAALALVTTVSPAASASPETVQPTMPATVRAEVPRRRHRRDRVAVSQLDPSSDAAEIERQIERRVLMPVLSGDGGG